MEELNNTKQLTTLLSEFKYKENRILFVNAKGRSGDEMVNYIDEMVPYIRTMPKNSVLMLSDFTDFHYHKEAMEAGKDFIKGNKPYVKKSALLGINGLHKIALNSFIMFSGRNNLKAFSTREEALEWLLAD